MERGGGWQGAEAGFGDVDDAFVAGGGECEDLGRPVAEAGEGTRAVAVEEDVG